MLISDARRAPRYVCNVTVTLGAGPEEWARCVYLVLYIYKYIDRHPDNTGGPMIYSRHDEETRCAVGFNWRDTE
jgi:hypothetical protein